jgi:ferredoxin
VTHKLWVACKSLAEGDQALAECEVACTGCARCAADAPDVITMVDNLAVVDYAKKHLAARHAIERCPTGAIGWWEGPTLVKGAAAKRIVRKQPLPLQED